MKLLRLEFFKCRRRKIALLCLAVLAVEAGNDLLCCTDFETQVPAVLAAVEDGTIPEARIDESVLRILEMKIELGLL